MPPVRSFSLEDSRVTSILDAVAFGGDRSGIDRGEAENGMQHGRLAGAVRADQAQSLLVADPQAEPVQDFHIAVAGVEIVDAQMRFAAAKRVEFRDADVARDFERLARHFLDRNRRRHAAVIAAGGRFSARHQLAPR